ncbi:MAG: HAMP domain-containing histidine kinase [Myxococcaceae bacterium]|nr:HAMP domain-containing histidine kinase [Myxococcaceae bacterium]
MTNLVVNALHACGPGGHVSLRTGQASAPTPGTTEAQRLVTIGVVDDGPGITPELRQTIFEPFFSTRAPGEGTGLGLPIAARIVEEHGGFIALDSTPGEGSTFTLHLPEAP